MAMTGTTFTNSKIILSALSVALTLSACATASFDPGSTIDTMPIIKNNSIIPANESVLLKEGMLSPHFEIAPAKIAVVQETRKIKLEGPGIISVSKGDHFFKTVNSQDQVIYCGFKNHHQNALKTILKQSCFADENENGDFESVYSRVGALSASSEKFQYYNAEVATLTMAADQDPISYQLSDPGAEFATQIAYRLREIKTKSDQSIVEFDIVTKRPDQELWVPFNLRNPIKITINDFENGTPFDTPLFQGVLLNPTKKSVTLKIISVPSEGTIRFKESLDPASRSGYKPAYKVSGF